MVEDAFGRDVRAEFEEIRTSGECATKKRNSLLLTKTLFTHYSGQNFSFSPHALQKSKLLQKLQKHLAHKHLSPQKILEIFKLFSNVFLKIFCLGLDEPG